VNLLAGVAEELGAVGTLDCGLVLFTQLTLDIIRINLGTRIGRRQHRTDSEVIGREILNSPPWNLKRSIAPWTLDFPAGAY